ncbi:MAG: tyrosine-type recombinase/integrase [Methylocella sp.]|nr:MAG: integrase [Hyphomicrobiales bacterium]
MAKALTQFAIDNLIAGPARREVPDGHTRGLFLIIQPSGAKSWALRYRVNGLPRKYTLGPHPAIGLGVARRMAQEALGSIARGEDPAAQKRARRATAKAGKRPASDLVEKVIDDFIALYAKPNTRDWRETERLLKQFSVAWRGRRLAEIDKPDIHRVLDAIVARGAPVQANRAFAQLRKMCRWACSRGIIDRSPCEGIARPSAEVSRDRVLNLDELRPVWRAADNLGFPFGPIVKLLVLTGQRRSEIGGMEWGEIDLSRAIWTIPAARSKNRRQHVLPLSPQVVEIIESLPRFSGSKFVFGPGETAPSGFSHAKTRLDALIAKMNGGEPVPPWVLHDLRRSAASGFAGLGVNLPVIDRCLNHVCGSFAGIVGVYQRFNYADEMRAAMERWGRHVEALASGAPTNVVELKLGA